MRDRPPADSSGAVSGRSEPWRRTPQPLAHSAKAHPPQSLLSERRPDAAEPTKTAAERYRAGASLGGEHSTPSRKARKLILPRAYSASRGPMPRSQPKPQRSGFGPERALEANTHPPRAQRESSSSPEPTQRAEARCRGAPPSKTEAERCQAGASLGGEHPTPSRKARKLILPRAYSASGGLIPRSPAYQDLSPSQPTHQPDSVLFSADSDITVSPPA
jgi:hypothetical protein